MNKRRLNALIKFMDKIPIDRFRMYSWFCGSADEIKLDKSCGTTACALGWATAVPSLRRAGLRMGRNAPYLEQRRVGPLTSASQLFGITIGQADDLFGAGHSDDEDRYDMTPKEWAKMATRYIKQWETEERKAANEKRDAK